jgi:hypothetical protein
MFKIQHFVDLYVDACIRDESGKLVFMSVFGRDTAIKELMARIHLQDGHLGLSELVLTGCGEWHHGQTHTVYLPDPKILDKTTGRMPTAMYGDLTHMWLYIEGLHEPDKGAKQAWVIRPGGHSADNMEILRNQVWQVVCELATVPLLPHWRDAVLTAIWPDMVFKMGQSTGDGTVNPRFSKPLGKLVAFRVCLRDDFEERVSLLIRQRKITLEAPPAITSIAVLPQRTLEANQSECHSEQAPQ